MNNVEYQEYKSLHREILLGLMEMFSKVAKSLNIRFWLHGGTLLGAVRHGGFIPWDSDVDLMVMADDIDSLTSVEWPDTVSLAKVPGQLLYTLNRRGTTSLNMRNRGRTKHNIRKGVPSGIKIEIFPVVNIPENNSDAVEFAIKANRMPISESVKAYRGSKLMSPVVTKHLNFPSSCFSEDPIYVKFEDTMMPIMRDYDIVLSENYGEDYMMPKNWRYHHMSFVDFCLGWENYSVDLVPDKFLPAYKCSELMIASGNSISSAMVNESFRKRIDNRFLEHL